MEHEGKRPHTGTDDERHGDGQDHRQLDIGRSIRPGVSMPPTVLITELDNGSLILQGRPDGPRAHLSPDDAVPLRQELARAFSRIDLTPCDGQGEAL